MERKCTRTKIRRRHLTRQIIVAACWLTVGFGVGVIVTLKAVGFS